MSPHVHLHVIVSIKRFVADGASKLHRTDKDLSRRWYPKPSLSTKIREAFLHFFFLYKTIHIPITEIRDITNIWKPNVQTHFYFHQIFIFLFNSQAFSFPISNSTPFFIFLREQRQAPLGGRRRYQISIGGRGRGRGKGRRERNGGFKPFYESYVVFLCHVIPQTHIFKGLT